MSLPWTIKKQLTYFSVFFIVIVFTVLFFVLKIVAPTCFDGKQNQDEKDVDCGGVCSQECLGEIKNLVVLWSKPLRISEGKYDIVALVENRNLFLSAKSARYQFKIYDDRNILIATRDGEIFVNPGQKFAIFENNIDVGARKPAKAFLEFQKDIKWGIHKEENLGLVIVNKEYKNDPRPSISATLENKTLANIKGVYAVAIVYDEAGNAIASSATKIKEIKKESSSDLFFTWTEHFEREYFRDEIYFSAQSVSSL